MPARPRSRALVIDVAQYTLAVANEPFHEISGEGRMNWPPSLSSFLVLNSVNKVRPQTARRLRHGPRAARAPRLPHTCKQITLSAIVKQFWSGNCRPFLIGQNVASEKQTAFEHLVESAGDETQVNSCALRAPRTADLYHYTTYNVSGEWGASVMNGAPHLFCISIHENGAAAAAAAACITGGGAAQWEALLALPTNWLTCWTWTLEQTWTASGRNRGGPPPR